MDGRSINVFLSWQGRSQSWMIGLDLSNTAGSFFQPPTALPFISFSFIFFDFSRLLFFNFYFTNFLLWFVLSFKKNFAEIFWQTFGNSNSKQFKAKNTCFSTYNYSLFHQTNIGYLLYFLLPFSLVCFYLWFAFIMGIFMIFSSRSFCFQLWYYCFSSFSFVYFCKDSSYMGNVRTLSTHGLCFFDYRFLCIFVFCFYFCAVLFSFSSSFSFFDYIPLWHQRNLPVLSINQKGLVLKGPRLTHNSPYSSIHGASFSGSPERGSR